MRTHINRYLAPPRTWSVSTTGNDANSGNAQSPWLTLAYACNNALVQPADRIVVLAGTYTEHVHMNRGGKPRKPITLQASPGASVTMDGAATEGGCIQANSHLYGYWTIRGIHFHNTGPDATGAHAISAIEWDGPTEVDIPGWVVDGCSGNCGLYMAGSNIIVVDCSFDGTGQATAINCVLIRGLCTTKPLVLNCTLVHFTTRLVWFLNKVHSPQALNNICHNSIAGIDFDGEGNYIDGGIIQGNTIDTCVNAEAGMGIELENCRNGPVINGNTIYSCDRGIEPIDYWDGGGAGATVNGIISNNLIYSCLRGITPHDTKGWFVYHNTCCKLGNYGFFELGNTIVRCDGWVLKNNLIYESANTNMQTYVVGDAWTQLTTPKRHAVFVSDYNLLKPFNVNHVFMAEDTYHDDTLAEWVTDSAADGQANDSHSINGDPLVTNYAGNDYTLQAGSPCKLAGTPIGILSDRLGNARSPTTPSLGCYE